MRLESNERERMLKKRFLNPLDKDFNKESFKEGVERYTLKKLTRERVAEIGFEDYLKKEGLLEIFEDIKKVVDTVIYKDNTINYEEEKDDLMEQIQKSLDGIIDLDQITIIGRVKRDYSIVKKLIRKGFNEKTGADLALKIYQGYKPSKQEIFEEVNDIVGVTIIYKDDQTNLEKSEQVNKFVSTLIKNLSENGKTVEEIESRIVKNRFGYKAPHIKIHLSSGEIYEVQTRSYNMHKNAETGPADHSSYKVNADLKTILNLREIKRST